MKHPIICILTLLFCFLIAGCTESNSNGNMIETSFKSDLEKIHAPNMSASILDASEADQLNWLAAIYEFEYRTMQSKTTGLTTDDLQLVKLHLAQVFTPQAADLVIEGFYSFNDQDKFYYVPDGDWFSYNERWPSKKLSVLERSEGSAVLELTGIDDYSGANQKIHYFLDIDHEILRLQKRVHY